MIVAVAVAAAVVVDADAEVVDAVAVVEKDCLQWKSRVQSETSLALDEYRR